VDDHPIVRRGLSQLIDNEPDLAVCGQGEEAYQALRGIRDAKPDPPRAHQGKAWDQKQFRIAAICHPKRTGRGVILPAQI